MREDIRAAKIKREKRARRVQISLRLLGAALALAVLVSFVHEHNFFARDDSGKGAVSSYAENAYAGLTPPKVYEGKAVKNRIRELADEDKSYQAIYDQYDHYPKRLLAALCSNSELLPFVQGYLDADGSAHGTLTEQELEAEVPLFLQWDERWGYAAYGDSNIALSGCAPTCVSMVAVALTGDKNASPDKVASYAASAGYYLAGTGTSWSFMTEGSRHFGIRGEELCLDENVIKSRLDAGHPIICSMRAGDFTTAGHFIVLAGVRDGKLIVRDPNSRRRSEVLWTYERLSSQIKNLWVFSAA